MNPFQIRIASWLLIGLLPLLAGCGRPRPADLSGWNCLLLTLDTLRQDRVGIYGHRTARTHYLDRLGREGMVFDHAVASTPTTLPSHTSILTGTHPPLHGVRGNAFYSLPDERETLAEILRDSGYQTGAVIAAMVLERRYGLAQGFDAYDDDSDAMAASAQFDASRPAHEVTKAAFRTAAKLDRSKPWFLWLHYYDPHLPHTPRPDFTTPGADPEDPSVAYDAEVGYMDRCIGFLIDEFENQGLLDKTLIVIVADHGEGFAGPHEEKTHGMFLYQDTQRVPLIVHAKGAIRGGRRTDALVQHIDLAPTILDLLGIEIGDEMQGESFRGVLEGRRPVEGSVSFSETMLPWDAYGWSPLFQVRDARWKYIEGPYAELYDLAEDPDEAINVADQNPERVADLRSRLQSTKGETSSGDALSAGLTESSTDLRRLEELGYVIGGRGTNDLPELSTLRHPRDVYPIVEQLDDATLLEAMGRNAEAIRLLEKVRNEDPNNYDVLRRLAQLRLAEGQWHPATQVARRLTDIRPDLPHSYYLLADVLSTHARVLERSNQPEKRREKIEEAIAVLQSIPREQLLGAGPATRLGRLLTQVGREQEALEALDRANRLDPTNYSANREAGEIRYRREDWAAAGGNLEAALEAAGGDEERMKPILVKLMSLYQKTERLDKAKATAELIRDRYPNDPVATLARRTLERLDKQ